MRRLALVALLLSGCGGAGSPEAAAPRPTTTAATGSEPRGTFCTSGGPTFRVCIRYPRDHTDTSGAYNGRIQSRESGRWKTLPVDAPFSPPSSDGAVVGHWERVFPSPDGGWLLAQWSAECEVPIAFLVPAAGGKPRAVATDRYGPAMSSGLGWTTDGRAIVELPSGACGGDAERPGVYLISADTREREYWRAVGTVAPSLTPRDAS